MKKSLLFKIVRIEFMDHAEGTVGLVRCVAYGVVHRETDEEIVITSWDCLDTDDAVRAANCKIFAIGKGLITDIKVLRAEKLGRK
jgi:hypothetical protein